MRDWTCRDCAGDPCLCRIGDHCDYKGPSCSCCRFVNYRWLGYLGARARWAKAWGISEDAVEERWQEEPASATDASR